MNAAEMWTDEIKTAAYIYRAEEKERYRAIETDLKQKFLADPGLDRAARAAWRGVEEDIMARFRAMIPKNGKGGPLVFEVHHEIAVGKECFLVQIAEHGDIDAAAAFTRRRLALEGDPADFYHEAGFLPCVEETGPDPM